MVALLPPDCIFDSELIRAADIDFSDGEPITLSSRVGRVEGNIQRLPRIIAAEEGRPLLVEPSVFVTEH